MTVSEKPPTPTVPPRTGNRSVLARRQATAGRMFIAPNLLAGAVFMLFPLGFSLYIAFQKWNLFTPPKVVWWANLPPLFAAGPLFRVAVRQTRVLTVRALV